MFRHFELFEPPRKITIAIMFFLIGLEDESNQVVFVFTLRSVQQPRQDLQGVREVSDLLVFSEREIADFSESDMKNVKYSSLKVSGSRVHIATSVSLVKEGQ